MTIEGYLAAYPALAERLPGQQLAWLQQFRQSGLQAFADHGFPSVRDEEWRYTSLAALSKTAFAPTVVQTAADETLADYRVAGATLLVLVNGHFVAALSDMADLPAGVTVMSMAQAVQQQAATVADYLGKAVAETEHSLVAFSNAWFADGVWLEVAAKQVVSKPLQIVHLVTESTVLAATRQLVLLHPQAEVDIIETFVGSVDHYFTACVNECFVEQNARLRWHKLQLEANQAQHFGGTYAKQAPDSHFSHHHFAFGSLLARSDIHSDLDTAAECVLNGLFVASQRQHIDNHTRIHHLKPHGISREFYKGVLNDKARGVFQGRVVVAEGAQHTDSEMNNRNLLLSADAEVDTKPQLEIYNDDVKCSHGVTVGQLDEQSIFYLQSRGIDAASARNLLTFAFANEMVDKLEDEALKALVVKALLERFPAITL
jgi:Fe-S cluster assembly protein SufD